MLGSKEPAFQEEVGQDTRSWLRLPFFTYSFSNQIFKRGSFSSIKSFLSYFLFFLKCSMDLLWLAICIHVERPIFRPKKGNPADASMRAGDLSVSAAQIRFHCY